jgi:uncharacterized damage-inducible protein DinB/heme-degrading monooxygenase HmoA
LIFTFKTCFEGKKLIYLLLLKYDLLVKNRPIVKKPRITRLWRGVTRDGDAAAYLDYLLQTGARDYRAVAGNRGVRILYRTEGERTHFWVLSEWKTMESIRAFAGDSIEQARFYAEDDRFLVEKDLRVQHFETVAVSGELDHFAAAFANTYEGSPWYGEPLSRILAAISFEQASARPLPGVHTIFELLGHCLAWRNFALAALRGDQIPDPAADESLNFPTGEDATPAGWDEMRRAFHENHKGLLAAMRQLDDRLLDLETPGRGYSFRFLLNGILQHDLYHFGQIRMLHAAQEKKLSAS